MGAIKYYCGTVPVPYRLERDRGTVPRATSGQAGIETAGEKNVYFSLKKKKINPWRRKRKSTLLAKNKQNFPRYSFFTPFFPEKENVWRVG